MLRSLIGRRVLALGGVAFLCVRMAVAEEVARQPESDRGTPRSVEQAPTKAELEAAFGKMLSGATLEGSFTTTGEGADSTKLSREKYTLGDVKKLQGDYWLIPARIEYGEKDVTIPLTLPVRWAGDTPMIVVDELGLPGFGTVSARVMFFADHYAGYWKHGKSGGHLFGTISREKEAVNDSRKNESPRSIDPANGEQVE
jgi:hypothetical protein